MKHKTTLNTFVSILLFLSLIGQDLIAQPINTTDQKVAELLKKMTLEEKIGQMNQYNGFWDFTGPVPERGDIQGKLNHLKSGLVGSMLNVRGVDNVRKIQKIVVEESRLGIPLIFGYDVIHGMNTISPIPLGESASWDMVAIEKSARMAAVEASAEGIQWTFAPMVDITRDARWGRVMEGAGEDPFLGSKIAAARVKGFQGDDLALPNTVLACAKHFAGYGFAESGKDYNTVDFSQSTLHNVVLPPFKACVDQGVGSFMNSFNDLNGIPATAHAYLQREILKGKWGFQGFVVSDWGSIGEMIAHRYAKDLKEASRQAVLAGCDMDMESYGYINHIKSLVESGQVNIQVIDEAVTRILRVKFELGLFDDPYLYCDNTREKTWKQHPTHHQVAMEMAEKSMVLLKNEKSILPLEKSNKKIALIGALADDKNSPLGNWRLAATPNSAISVKEAMENYGVNDILYAHGPALSIGAESFAEEVVINSTDTTGWAQTIRTAKQADVVVMVLGEHGLQSGEGRSRADIGLPGLQQPLLEAVYKVNPNIVLVIMNGRPLTLDWAAKYIPAILVAWQPGSQSGHAITRVLYGDYNPSGKLPMSFPRSVAQLPIYYNYKSTGRPGPKKEVFWSHYTDESNAPLFPFGFGLSYTNFTYNNFRLVNKNENKFTISVDVTNTGGRDGEEVIQLYIRDEVASITRPVRELKGFQKLSIPAKQTRTVRFEIGPEELGFYNNSGEFVVEPGEFTLFVGGSSQADLSLAITLED